MFTYYNANPYERNVNDCSVREISLATNTSWDNTYDRLSEYAKRQKITFSEVEFLNDYLEERFEKFIPKYRVETLQDFLDQNVKGRFLVTMAGHITCVIDGVLYDTFDCSNRYVWNIYRVE